MSRFLHTMVRITDPERSRVFCEALGMEFRHDLPIIRLAGGRVVLKIAGSAGDPSASSRT